MFLAAFWTPHSCFLPILQLWPDSWKPNSSPFPNKPSAQKVSPFHSKYTKHASHNETQQKKNILWVSDWKWRGDSATFMVDLLDSAKMRIENRTRRRPFFAWWRGTSGNMIQVQAICCATSKREATGGSVESNSDISGGTDGDHEAGRWTCRNQKWEAFCRSTWNSVSLWCLGPFVSFLVVRSFSI